MLVFIDERVYMAAPCLHFAPLVMENCVFRLQCHKYFNFLKFYKIANPKWKKKKKTSFGNSFYNHNVEIKVDNVN